MKKWYVISLIVFSSIQSLSAEMTAYIPLSEKETQEVNIIGGIIWVYQQSVPMLSQMAVDNTNLARALKLPHAPLSPIEIVKEINEKDPGHELDSWILQTKMTLHPMRLPFRPMMGQILRDYERKLWNTFPTLAKRSYYLAIQAYKASERRFQEYKQIFPTADMHAKDSFRHAYWAALLSKYMGARVALVLVSIHEIENYMTESLELDTDNNDTIMDFANNQLGIMYGNWFSGLTDDEIEEVIYNKVAKGDFYQLDFESKNFGSRRHLPLIKSYIYVPTAQERKMMENTRHHD